MAERRRLSFAEVTFVRCNTAALRQITKNSNRLSATVQTLWPFAHLFVDNSRLIYAPGVYVMAQKESQMGRAEKSLSTYPFASTFAEFAAIGSKRIDELANLQTDLLNQFQTSNRQWFDRAQSEANFVSEFVSKLTAAHSIPEALTACQEWAGRRLELAAEDGRILFADAQKFMESGSRLLLNGWLTNSGDST
jgi:hypothetical protein